MLDQAKGAFDWLFEPDKVDEGLSTSNLHAHQCSDPACGTIWRHDPDTIPSGERCSSHSCPRCGKLQYLKLRPFVCHGGPDDVPAEFCNNGVRTLVVATGEIYESETKS